jgi:hypothetical protein
MNEIAGKLGANSIAMIYSIIDANGEHDQESWLKWFPEFYKWIMADGFNVITNSKN